jgi:hypothetical protein
MFNQPYSIYIVGYDTIGWYEVSNVARENIVRTPVNEVLLYNWILFIKWHSMAHSMCVQIVPGVYFRLPNIRIIS